MTQQYLILDTFLGLLEQQTELFQVLLTVIDDERNAVIAANLEKLNEAGKIKENLLLKLRILEEQRKHLLAKLADHLHQPVEALTLAKLSQLVAEPYAHRLAGCRSMLAELIRKIRKANEDNRDLFAHSLNLVKSSINLINNLMSSSPVYFRTGNIHRRDHTGKILYSEV
ncbi:MAG: flagellar protein FlgN [Desulfobacterales bacterium]|nr:MAG: flagellar protein FlgN [Desulfobacterales bacterium]